MVLVNLAHPKPRLFVQGLQITTSLTLLWVLSNTYKCRPEVLRGLHASSILMTGNEELGTLTALSPLPCGTGSEPEIHQKPKTGLKRRVQDLESSKGEACKAGQAGRRASC